MIVSKLPYALRRIARYLLQGFLNLSGRLARDKTAGTTVLVTLGTIAVVGVIGLTIDGARALYVKERLISALDAAALAGGRVVNSTTPGQWQTDAWMYFHANFPDGYLGTVMAAPTPTNPDVFLNDPYNTALTVQQYVTVPSTIMRAFGVPDGLTLGARSVAQTGKIELSLVLDNTGSMNQVVGSTFQTKLQALQAAAHQLVTTLTGGSSGNIRISIVPFNTTVNVGAAYQGSAWIDAKSQYIYGGYVNPLTGSTFQDIFTDPAGANYQQDRFALLASLGTNWAGCVETRPPPYDVQDDAPVAANPATLYVPYFAPDEPSGPLGVLSVAYPNDYLKDASTGSSAPWQVQQGYYSKYLPPQSNGSILGKINGAGYALGPNAGCVGFGTSGTVTVAPVQPLTMDPSILTAEINTMHAMGDTYIPAGMQMGWMTISPNSPFPNTAEGSPPVPYNTPGINKVVVLLTDGCNHLTNPNHNPATGQDACGNVNGNLPLLANADASYYSSIGYIWQGKLGDPAGLATEPLRQSAADGRMTQLCQNMKQKGITIFTILLGSQANAAPAVMSQCASSSDDYFPVADPANLNNVFETIAEKLTLVHLVQ